MDRELLTYPITDTQIRDELTFTIAHLRESGFTTCNLMFGWAWGMEYYPNDHWDAEPVPLDSVLAKVAEVEGRGIGRLGSDDLFLKFPTFSFLFCNDSDVHIRYTEDSALVEFFFARWEQLGYKPAEWRSTEGGPKVRVRGGDTNA